MSTNEVRKNPTTLADNATRATLINALYDHFADAGMPVDRINDYATLCVEVNGRPMVVKVVAPKLYDKDGETLFSVDEGILAYESRVQSDKEKAEKKAKKEAEAEAKKAAIEARKSSKNS